ncbi:MAG: YdjY domain-containing protein [Pirellulaceae bacterium]
MNSLTFRSSSIAVLFALLAMLFASVAAAQDPPPIEQEKEAEAPDESKSVKPDPPGLTRLAKDYDVWVDMKRKLVVVDGKICLRRGPLEMFACPKGTKEHEAVVAVNSPAQFVHAGLLAVGAKAGHPVRFRPEYVAAEGTIVDIWVLWKDERGENQKVRAQEMVKNEETGKAMTYNWVFGGSGFWVDEETGERHYHGDGGDFICVSNFSTATLDLPVESSQANDALLFAAFTEKIPPMDTEVRLVLVPRIPRTPKASGDSSDPPKDEPAEPEAAPPEKDAGEPK